MNGHTVAAGLGPWTLLVDRVWRLLLLHDIGRDSEVIQLVEQYDEEMSLLPENYDRREATTPWTVKELLFEAGRVAAFGLGRWKQALYWNARSVENQRERKAPELELARLRINDCEALVKLRQSTKAYELALDCRKIFERENSAVDIATAFSALATVEAARGNTRRAIAHERTALRHRYSEQSPDAEACAECHYRLASYLARDNMRSAAAANRLSSALIRVRTISTDTTHVLHTLDQLRTDLARLDPSDPPVPTCFDDLVTFIDEVEGLPFAAFFDGLPAAREMDADVAIRCILERVAYRATGHLQLEAIGEPDETSARKLFDGLSAGLNSHDLAPQGAAMQWQASGDEERRMAVVGQQPLPAGAEREEDNCTFLVYYATDRTRVRGEGRPVYSGRMDSKLHFGHIKVSVPYHREMATVRRPRWWQRQSPSKHIIFLDGSEVSRNEFLGTLAGAMREAGQPVALVFIHGFNVGFDAAVHRTAQIAYDLHFEGTPILYSWPSEGKISSYGIDGENARQSATHLHAFLRMVLTEVGVRTVHVIAHSMGNRVLMEALRDLDLSTLPVDAATLCEVVFAAPDVRSDLFLTLVSQVRTYARRFTLYASSFDKALRAATKLQGGYPRAGYAGSDILLAEGIDTIDASNVETDFLDHSYFGSNKSIITDLFQLLRNGQTPLERGLQSLERDGRPYWVVPA
jgi:esterase/lipase superfamily enzyme